MKYYRMKTLFILTLSLFVSISASADTDSKKSAKTNEIESISSVENITAMHIFGVVLDEKSNETLAGATIVVDGKKYYSDLDGNFSVYNVKPGNYEMVVELISYEPITLVVDPVKNQIVNINLHQK